MHDKRRKQLLKACVYWRKHGNNAAKKVVRSLQYKLAEWRRIRNTFPDIKALQKKIKTRGK